MDKALALREVDALIKKSKAPAELSKIIDLHGWAASVITGSEYKEPDPEFISRMIAFQTITAETLEGVFRQQNIQGLQRMIPDVPGQGTGAIEITDLYVATSDFETGNPSYVIITATSLEHGYEWKATTGATNIQATLIALLAHGMWPIRCQIKRGDSKDKGGRYLFFVVPAD